MDAKYDRYNTCQKTGKRKDQKEERNAAAIASM